MKRPLTLLLSPYGPVIGPPPDTAAATKSLYILETCTSNYIYICIHHCSSAGEQHFACGTPICFSHIAQQTSYATRLVRRRMRENPSDSAKLRIEFEFNPGLDEILSNGIQLSSGRSLSAGRVIRFMTPVRRYVPWKRVTSRECDVNPDRRTIPALRSRFWPLRARS